MSPRPAIDHIRKPQIIKAAAEVITERGLAATRIADVAERAGTSPPAVLYWFESREQLLNEALTADEGSFAADLDERLRLLPNASARLREVIVASSTDGDLSLWIELWARALHDEPSRVARQRLDEEWRRRIAAIVEEGQAAGEFESGVDAGEAAVAIATVIDALAVQVTLEDPAVSSERMMEICIDFVAGMLDAELSEPDTLEEVGA